MDGIGVVSVTIGVVFAWGGVKGYSPLRAAENIITGKNPNENQSGNSLVSSSSSGASSSAAPTVSGNYSNSQLQQLWISQGGDPSKASVAACIATHESRGNPNATSNNPDGGINVGLWQLDTKGKGLGHSEDELKNPATNAAIAILGSSNGTDWSAWSTAPLCGV